MNDNKIAELQQEICNLTAELGSDASDIGDWKIIKCQEYILAGKEAPYDLEELNSKRDTVRKRINDIQKEIEELISKE